VVQKEVRTLSAKKDVNEVLTQQSFSYCIQ
jgi:hypothetical protein